MEAAAAKTLSHFDGHGAPAAGGEQHRRIPRVQGEVGKDHFGQALHLLEEHRLALAVGAHHLVVVGQRQLHDRMEARKAAVARKDFFDAHAGVAGAKQVHQPSLENRGGAPAGGLRDGVELSFGDAPQDGGGAFEILRSVLAHPSTIRPSRMWTMR